ncbi:MAG: hypothetical protein WDN30_04570 [Pararobbsia sp.]
MFAVRPPENNFSASATAFAELKQEFERAEIQVAAEDDKDRILEFASTE